MILRISHELPPNVKAWLLLGAIEVAVAVVPRQPHVIRTIDPWRVPQAVGAITVVDPLMISSRQWAIHVGEQRLPHCQNPR